MRLSTLVVVGALLFGGMYVHRNADSWMDSLNREKAELTAAAKRRLETEKDKVKKRLETETDKLAATVKERLESEKDKAAAAVKNRLDAERRKAAVKERLKNARERAAERVAGARGAAEAKLPAVAAPGLPQTDVAPEAMGDQANPPAVAAPGLPQTDVAPEAMGDRANPPAAVSPSLPQTEAAPAVMDEAAFWRLIEETRGAAGDDTGAQTELLEERVTRLSPDAILEFARIRRRLDERAYTSDLWAAATVIEDGCSDDCFRDFRGYLISLGQGPYEDALRDPDSLASIVQDEEGGNWEHAYDVAPDAYTSVTGTDFPLDESDLSGDPRGAPFDEDDSAALVSRYPQLAARFR